ncbi:hypothetical protein CGCA056_v014363 [Colletotrichum aenigma]|uniref:uncharacterized protein n=1 Tax=Colletotrichum aenigma TaxID=1215731 RepID=UPI00187334C9|nr:uncharacterized protein CGCA056_v014363 [Colletotrichum aenigma]KAF5502553.1 hypothetical protein CGCA056_v014363 [Colletotrichum aenigma]
MTYSRAQRRAQEHNEKLLRLDGKGVHFPPGPCLGSDKTAAMAMRILRLEPSELCPKPDYEDFESNLRKFDNYTTLVASGKETEFNSHVFWTEVLDECNDSYPIGISSIKSEVSRHGRSVKNAIFRIVNTYRKARRRYIQLHMDEDNTQRDRFNLLARLDQLEDLDQRHLRNGRRNRRKLRARDRNSSQSQQHNTSPTAHDAKQYDAPCVNNAEDS